MRKMTEADRLKMEKTKNFLSLYSLAIENLKVISELEQHINENLNNPSIGGKGYLTGSGKPYLSGGAGAAVIKADSMQSYSQSQTERNQEIMKDIENAIALLDISKGKTILERRFLLMQSWEEIRQAMNLCRDTCYKFYRDALVELYNKLYTVEAVHGQKEFKI